MSDDVNKGSKMPFSAPPAMAAPPNIDPKYKGPKTPISNKKQLKNAKKKKPKSAIGVRSVLTGLFILAVTSIAVTAVTSPQTLGKFAAGEIIERTETCLVTETNASLYFDTDCGKFQWNSDRQPGTPSTKLAEGSTYTIKSTGIRIGMAKLFPSVVAYEKVA